MLSRSTAWRATARYLSREVAALWRGLSTTAASSPSSSWVILAVATVVALLGAGVKWLLPGKRLKSVGVPNTALFAGGVLGLIGFFVVPVVGVIIGFVLGVWLVERVRLGPGRAWPSTREAITAAGLAMLIEFTTSLAVAVVWVFGLLAA